MKEAIGANCFARKRWMGGYWLLLRLTLPQAVALGFAGGNGTADKPYLVASAAQIDAVRQFPGAHFRQTADIELSSSPYPLSTPQPSQLGVALKRCRSRSI